MSTFRICLLFLCLLSFKSSFTFGQITYFDQDYTTNPPTGSGLGFDHYIATKSATISLSNGALEMTRTINPDTSETSGLVRAIRTTPFSANPETLYIQITFYAKDISNKKAPAVYFFIGKDFVLDNKIPENIWMFSRFTLNFTGTQFEVRDLVSNVKSPLISVNQPVTLTWVLNNSRSSAAAYKFPENNAVANYTVGSLKYDLWVDGQLLVDEASGYIPASLGASDYKKDKLTNFEIRFRNGFGTLVFTKIKIRDIDGVLPIAIHDFKTEKSNKDVNLSWGLSGTWDSTYVFQVQRSKDGLEFETVGNVPISERQNRYEFKESFSSSNIQYYRIVGFNSEGSLLAKSKLVLVQGEIEELVSNISPNPVDNNFFVLNENEPTSHYKIFNSVGSEVPMQSIIQGNTKVGFYPLMPLQAGLYVLEYQRANLVVRKKLVVR